VTAPVTAPPRVAWRERGVPRTALWLSGIVPAPARIGAADDRTTAAAALARVRAGEALAYAGDYRNARQLLAAMGRRLARALAVPGRDVPAAFRAERARRRAEHDLLTRLCVPVEGRWAVTLARAPDVAVACEEALGAPPGEPGLLPLRELLGIVGAHEWRVKGVEVPALGGRVHPHYGVYAPVRGEYVDLVAAACVEWPVGARSALEVGTGTGVLAALLARAGARVVATDVELRAIVCARENFQRLGLADRVTADAADLFPPGAEPFDLVVSNPPWLPADAASPLERAVYDPGGRFLQALVAGLPGRLAPGGEAWIVLSDLAERVGLRAPGALEALFSRAGLAVAAVREARPRHRRARDAGDPLHAARAGEVTRLFRVVPAER
jgi:SAM-dependent methyltransferase